MTPRESRIDVDLEVTVRRPEELRTGAGRVKNLSASGLLLVGGEQLTPGDAIAVEIPANEDHGRVLVLGEVAWSDRDQQGMRFHGMLPHHRARFKEILSALAAA